MCCIIPLTDEMAYTIRENFSPGVYAIPGGFDKIKVQRFKCFLMEI